MKRTHDLTSSSRRLSVVAAMIAGTVCGAEVSFREPEIIPVPQKVECQPTVEVRLGAKTPIALTCADGAAAEWARRHLKSWFGFDPKIDARQDRPDDVAGDEGYRLSAKPGLVAVRANSLAGVRHAFHSLRQIVERDSSGETVSGWRLPAVEIADSPVLTFRGLHLCWFPEQTADLIERQIRTAAAYKFNVVVLESWGVFASERHPWFGWPEKPMTKTVISHLVKVAADEGVTLVPQLNAWGHAAAARSCTGKHAALDVHPERQALFEPWGGQRGSMSSGWNWCLSNPEAVRVVRELVAELHEAFGNPPYFHIGCDEADVPTCASCRAVPYAQLVADHIRGIGKLLETRGARMLMWHDMLLKRGDPRWKGFYANGSDETAKLPALLPKSLIVCDWYYGSDPGGTSAEKDRKSLTGKYPTLDYFSKDCGFETLTCPWEEPKGIRAQTAYAREHGLFGVLGTVWHHFSGPRFPCLVQMDACGAWGRGERLSNGHFATVWRQCGWDAGAPAYRTSGWYDTQVSRDIQGR